MTALLLACALEATLPVVEDLPTLEANAGERVTVHGTVITFEYGRGSSRSLGGALRLADGTRVVVSYGALPDGWSSWQDQPVAVDGRIHRRSPPSRRSGLMMPHLDELGTPRGKPER